MFPAQGNKKPGIAARLEIAVCLIRIIAEVTGRKAALLRVQICVAVIRWGSEKNYISRPA